jgi:hypothetical protein
VSPGFRWLFGTVSQRRQQCMRSVHGMRFGSSRAGIADFSKRRADIHRLKRLKQFNDCDRAGSQSANSGEIAVKWRFLKTFTAFLRAKILSSAGLVMRMVHGCSDALALFATGLHAYIRINRETRAAKTLPGAENPRKGDLP